MKKPKILYVDDESINLTNFTRTFENEYDIRTALSGDEALAVLEKEGEQAMVVTDQRMPGLSGVDLLFKVKELYPDTIRIVLTAYTKTEYLMDSINRGHVHSYIVKPWEESYLRMTLKNGVESYRLATENETLLAELEEKNIALARVNAELEERVTGRTAELHKANRHLQNINEQLVYANNHIKNQRVTLETQNQELEIKIEELKKERDKVKKLQNLIPICSYCRKIRDDKDYWQELHLYMRQFPDFTFTHSICPECYTNHVRPQLDEIKEEEDRG